MAHLHAVILAGGPMHRATGGPRTLLAVRGTPLLGYAIDLAERFEPEFITVVAGEGAEQIAAFAGPRAQVLRQVGELGSGHAVALAVEARRRTDGELLVIYADRIFLREETLRSLLGARRHGRAAALLSVNLERPAGYSRIIRDFDGQVLRASSDCEVNQKESRIREVVAGAYSFDIASLREVLPPAATIERKTNLTEFVGPLVAHGHQVVALAASDPAETRGIYSEEEALQAELLTIPSLRAPNGRGTLGS